MQLSFINRTSRHVAGSIICVSLISAAVAASALASQPVPPPIVTHLPSVLTLQDAIAIALREQPQVTVAKASVDSALGTREQASSEYLPTITPTYSFENNRDVEYGISRQQIVSVGTGTNQTTTIQQTPGDATNVVRGGGATISLKQTLIDSGQRELQNAEARQQVEGANYTSDDTREQIVANVTSSYYGLLQAQDLVKVAQAQVTENQQTVDLTQAELTAGTAAKTDVYTAQANLATAQVTLITDQNNVQTSVATLKNAMGVVTDDPVQPQSLSTGTALPPIPQSPVLQSLDQYYKLAQQNRADLKAQLSAVDDDRDAVKVARINAGLSLSVDYLLTYQPDNDIGPKGTDSLLTLTGSAPLFDGGYSKGAVRIADANLESALASLEATRQTILEAVEQDYATRQESLDAITYAQVAVQAGQVNYDAAVASREAGVGTVLQITTAEATLTQAQSQYVTAIYNYYVADSNLQRAAGLD
jgi:outer membrane protein TolC